jgi:DNA-binding NarL/FixJ family response regulator
MIRLILVEDYAIIRAGLCRLMNEFEDITVVAAAADGESSVKLAVEHQPDIVLMDIELPGISGLNAASQILKHCPHVRILLLSNYAGEAYVTQAIKIGAKGYVKKDSDVADIRKAIDTVMSGQMYLAPNVLRFLVN